MNLFVADIDECYEAVHDCSAGSFCVNHEGNYHCKHNGIHITGFIMWLLQESSVNLFLALTSEAILIAITTTTCIITVLLIVTVAFLITRRT